MINRIIEICLNRFYSIVLDVMSGIDFSKKNIGEKIFFISNLVFFLLNLINLIYFRSMLSEDLDTFNSQVAISAPYNHWFISILPRLFMIVYSLLMLVFSFFAHINTKSFYKLLVSVFVISILRILCTYGIFMIDNFYIIILLLTLITNITGILSLFSYIYFI